MQTFGTLAQSSTLHKSRGRAGADAAAWAACGLSSAGGGASSMTRRPHRRAMWPNPRSAAALSEAARSLTGHVACLAQPVSPCYLTLLNLELISIRSTSCSSHCNFFQMGTNQE